MIKKRMFRAAALLLALTMIMAGFSGCLLSGLSPLTNAGIPELPEDLVETGESSVDPLFWVVTSEEYSGKVYLLGSMHACKKETFPLPEHIMTAYSEAESVAVECDTQNFEYDRVQQVNANQYIIYSDGTRIKDHLSEEVYGGAVKRLTDLGLYRASYDIYKPILWPSLFDTYIVEQSGLSYDYSIDEYFMTKAKTDGKELLEIESVEYQYEVMGGFSDELQEMMLEDYLPEGAIEEQITLFGQLYDRWASGDPTAASNEVSEEEWAEVPEEDKVCLEEYVGAMLENRNVRMTDAVESYIKRGMTVFMVVGTSHMVDKIGIVNSLRERGYTVTEHADRY